MALVPSINQNAANITFNSIIYGAEPSVLTPVSLASGFAYTAMGSLIGTSLASPGSSYFLFDETDATQQLYGITYDEWFNSVAFAGSQAPFTFTGNIATTAGSIYVPTVGNIAGSNGLNPYLATSVITGVSVNANNLTIGSAVRGTGLPANSTILAILSATVILVSGNEH